MLKFQRDFYKITMTGARNLMHVQEILMGPYPVESESITIEFLFCFIFFSTERKVKK